MLFGGRKGKVVLVARVYSTSPGSGRARPGARRKLVRARARCRSQDLIDVFGEVLASAALAAPKGVRACHAVKFVHAWPFTIWARDQAVCREFCLRSLGNLSSDTAARSSTLR